jgi:hypothetical protein
MREFAGIKCLTPEAIDAALSQGQCTQDDARRALEWLRSGAAAMGRRCRAAERIARAVYE